MVSTKSYWQNNQTLEVVAIVKTVPNQKDVFLYTEHIFYVLIWNSFYNCYNLLRQGSNNKEVLEGFFR